jgi:hypothetical protein
MAGKWAISNSNCMAWLQGGSLTSYCRNPKMLVADQQFREGDEGEMLVHHDMI